MTLIHIPYLVSQFVNPVGEYPTSSLLLVSTYSKLLMERFLPVLSTYRWWRKVIGWVPETCCYLAKFIACPAQDLPHRPQSSGDSLSCLTPVGPITMEFLCLFSEPSPALLLCSLSWETGTPANWFKTDSPIKDIELWQKKRNPSVHPSVSYVVFLFGQGSISSVPLSKAHL